ncbi:MAG TPA: twin-arginine translocase TatA/TatE family subunit [Candidatus Latescibacteria bacterium]|nr:twin-arginine translocase TatA/TatE family subunit [Candidatus Latescibacterota bacterium]
MFGGFGTGEILLIFLVILLLFGAKRIPEIAQGLGKGIREFRKATRDLKEEIDEAVEGKDESSKKELKG